MKRKEIDVFDTEKICVENHLKVALLHAPSPDLNIYV